MKALVLGFDTELDYLGAQQGWSTAENVAAGLEALRVITRHLQEGHAPATFFLVGNYVEQDPGSFVAVLGGKHGYEIASHTQTHIQMKDFPWHRAARPVPEIRQDLRQCNHLLRETFGLAAVDGLCVPGNYYQGLQDRADLQELLLDEGFRYVCADGRGPQETIPAPFTQPYWYHCGHRRLLEVPHTGWHCNILNGLMPHQTWWPPLPGAVLPAKKVETVEEQLAVYRQEFAYARHNDLCYAPTFHPWSIFRFDREVQVIRFLLQEAKQHAVPVLRYGDVFERMSQA